MRSALAGLLAITLALPGAFAQSGAEPTAEDIADLAPLMPRPSGGGDEPLASLAPKLVLAIAAERVQLQPVAAVATAGQRVPFTRVMAAPGAGQAGPVHFIVEQWRVDGIVGGNASVGRQPAQPGQHRDLSRGNQLPQHRAHDVKPDHPTPRRSP